MKKKYKKNRIKGKVPRNRNVPYFNNTSDRRVWEALLRATADLL